MLQDDARNISTGKAANSTLTKDKRNLYLAKEGLVAENTPAWEALSESDKWVQRCSALAGVAGARVCVRVCCVFVVCVRACLRCVSVACSD